MLQRCKIVQWPVWACTSDSRRNLLDCSKQVNFAKIFCGAKRSRRCMNTRSAFKYTYLLTWFLWLYNQLHPMKIITLCSIGFLKILFRGNSAVEMYLNTCFYILHLLTSSLLNGLKAIRCYALQIQRKTIPQHIWITFCFLLTTTAWSNAFTYLSYWSYLNFFLGEEQPWISSIRSHNSELSPSWAMPSICSLMPSQPNKNPLKLIIGSVLIQFQ